MIKEDSSDFNNSTIKKTQPQDGKMGSPTLKSNPFEGDYELRKVVMTKKEP